MKINIFNREVKDGISDMVAKGSISIASLITHDKHLSNSELPIELQDKINLAKASSNPNQIDLYYKHSILTSVGWNKNDDVFDRIETWRARHTVSDKQLNLEHNELDIVGHMTGSYVFDEHGNKIEDTADENSLPDRFDVVSEFVLYTMWSNEDRKKEIDKIVAEISDNKWFVSMECRFPAFDYALIDKDGNHKTIARTEETAFLSKYLRAFGGTGEYQGYKVGRLIRDFFFSGQGIVKSPANERSIIFDLSDVKPFVSKGSFTLKDNDMELEKEIERLKAELAASKASVQTAEIDKVKADLASVATAKSTLEAEVTSLKSAIADKDKAIATFTDELKVANDKITVASAEISAMKSQAKTESRKTQLISAGVLESEAIATVTKWDSLNDEQFAEIVSLHAAKKDMKDMKKDDKQKEMDETECKDKAKCSETTKASLDNAEIEKQASLNQTDSTKASRIDVLSSFLKDGLKYSAAASQRFKTDN